MTWPDVERAKLVVQKTDVLVVPILFPGEDARLRIGKREVVV